MYSLFLFTVDSFSPVTKLNPVLNIYVVCIKHFCQIPGQNLVLRTTLRPIAVKVFYISSLRMLANAGRDISVD